MPKKPPHSVADFFESYVIGNIQIEIVQIFVSVDSAFKGDLNIRTALKRVCGKIPYAVRQGDLFKACAVFKRIKKMSSRLSGSVTLFKARTAAERGVEYSLNSVGDNDAFKACTALERVETDIIKFRAEE